VKLQLGVDLKLPFEYKAAPFAQRRLIRGPQEVVKYWKNKKVSQKIRRKNKGGGKTKTKKQNNKTKKEKKA